MLALTGRIRRFLPLLAAATLLPAGAASSAETLRIDSRGTYVHRLNLLEPSEGELISPNDPMALPYSPARTCSKACHAYPEIAGGWHFNATDPSVPPGRPGQPWVLVDERTGTQLPLSYRRWRGASDMLCGTYHPSQIGLTPWEFVLRFGRHMPGGGVGERFAELTDRPNPRWAVSGPLQIDCMICHSAEPGYDASERARQIEQENFQWAPTAGLGLAVVRGSARARPPGFDPMMGQPAPPEMAWDMTKFDPDERVLFAMSPQADNQRCFFCHTNRPSGPAAAPAWQADRDVHLTAGMNCADCHRHGIAHDMVRGYEGEAADYHRPDAASLSCRGCHLGDGTGAHAMGGRLGAPRPEHRGLPALHLEKLTCTACHAGPLPSAEPGFFQTSMAHGLGLTDRGFGRGQAQRQRTDETAPRIVAPVFVRTADGKIGPHRMLWPAFWARRQGETLQPLAPEAVVTAAGELLARPAAAQPAHTLSRETIQAVLAKLAAQDAAAGEAVYVGAGLLYRLDEQGQLRWQEDPAAAPYAWAIGHDVRPAAQSLGAGGCTDCHADGAPFFFGMVRPVGMVADSPARAVAMHEFQQLDPTLQRWWGLSFLGRPWLKVVGLALAGLLGAVLLAYALKALAAVSRRAGDGRA